MGFGTFEDLALRLYFRGSRRNVSESGIEFDQLRRGGEDVDHERGRVEMPNTHRPLAGYQRFPHDETFVLRKGDVAERGHDGAADAVDPFSTPTAELSS